MRTLTIFLLLLCLTLQSCLSNKKMNRAVTNFYKDAGLPSEIRPQNQIIVHFTDSATVTGYSKSVDVSRFFLPLIIYYHTEQKKRCDINRNILVNAFLKRISLAAEDDRINRKIASREIHVTFKTTPTFFLYDFTDDSFTPFCQPFFLVIGVRKNILHRPNTTFGVDYEIKDKATSAVVKKGSVYGNIPTQFVRKRAFESRMDFIEEFTHEFHKNMVKAAIGVGDDLLKEL